MGNSLHTEGCVEWRCREAIFKLGLGEATQWVYGGTGATFDLVKTETLISVPSHFFPFPDRVRMSLGAKVFLLPAGFAAGR